MPETNSIPPEQPISAPDDTSALPKEPAPMQERLNRRFREFAPAPTSAEIHDLLGIHIDPQEAAALKQGDQELKEIDKVP